MEVNRPHEIWAVPPWRKDPGRLAARGGLAGLCFCSSWVGGLYGTQAHPAWLPGEAREGTWGRREAGRGAQGLPTSTQWREEGKEGGRMACRGRRVAEMVWPSPVPVPFTAHPLTSSP